MGAGFKHGGGGASPLNFKVVGGTTAPANPKENTIWVNTSTAITSYVFSATQPTGSAGMVWFTTGTASTAEFNALKKNGIQVYPLTAKQYVGGAWVDKTAKSYQGGEWVDWWNGEIFKDGKQYFEFEAINWHNKDLLASINITDAGTIDFVHGNQNGYSAVQTKEKIDLTEWNIVGFDIKTMLCYNGEIHFGVTDVSGAVENIWQSKTSLTYIKDNNSPQIVNVNVASLSGEYYIIIGFGHWDRSEITHVECNSIMLS